MYINEKIYIESDKLKITPKVLLHNKLLGFKHEFSIFIFGIFYIFKSDKTDFKKIRFNICE